MKEWVFGRNPVYEVLCARRRQAFRLLVAEGAKEKGRLATILGLASQSKVPIEQVTRGRLESIAPENQGVLLETGAYPYSTLADILELAESRQEPPFVLILDTLQDPQNLGALLRTGEIVGIHGVLLPYRHTATVTPAVVNASSGACEHLLIAQMNLAQAITQLKDAGVWVLGLEDSPEAQSIESVNLAGPLALVVGSEGEGMRQLVARSCDLRMRLPMRGKIESYNAAVAGSIALYLAWQARKHQ